MVIATQDAAEGLDSPSRGPADSRAAGLGAASEAAAACADMFGGGHRLVVAAVDADRVRRTDRYRGTVSAPGSASFRRRPSHRDSGRRRTARAGARIRPPRPRNLPAPATH